MSSIDIISREAIRHFVFWFDAVCTLGTKEQMCGCCYVVAQGNDSGKHLGIR
jgi:hypothetical protein